MSNSDSSSTTSEAAAAYRPHKDEDIVRSNDGRLTFDPYNSNNIRITPAEVQTILARYGVKPQIRNMALYERAFIHRSYTKRPSLQNARQNITITQQPTDCLPLSSKSNERMECLGDRVLEFVTVYHLYRRFPKEDEAFITKKKIDIVKNEAIGRIALEMGLQRWLVISKHAEEMRMRNNLKKLGCLFEAFIGAVFLDWNQVPLANSTAEIQITDATCNGIGFQVAQQFIENVFAQHIDWAALVKNDDNYKTILQIKILKEFKVTPHYLNLDPTVENQLQSEYKMGVYLCIGQPIHSVTPADAVNVAQFANYAAIHEYIAQHGGKIFMFIGAGQHRNKRKAEQMACSQAITVIEAQLEKGGAGAAA